jgi:hypothetical protein
MEAEVARPAIADALARQISPRGSNGSLQIEADMIFFLFFNPPFAPDGAASHINQTKNGLFFPLLF